MNEHLDYKDGLWWRLPSDDLRQGFDIAIDDIVPGVVLEVVAIGFLHDDEPVLEVAGIGRDGGFFEG